MAAKKPLVLTDGQIEQLQAGDTLEGAVVASRNRPRRDSWQRGGAGATGATGPEGRPVRGRCWGNWRRPGQ